MNYDVFISYAHEEVKTARRLADALVAARGWSVWWDTSLRTGEQYPRKIQDAVAASRSVVVLWSKDSTTSDWVMAEASEGWNRKVLVPVMLDGSEPPMPFRQTQARDFSAWSGGLRDPALLGLIEDIQRVHAVGPEVSAAELGEREARRRAYQRRLWTRRAAYAGAVLVVLIGGWFGWRSYQSHARVSATAERLAQQADAIRADALKLTPDEDEQHWWALLMENTGRLDHLELSVLLGIEAVRHHHTERTEGSLRDSFALLPWTDKQLKIERDDLPMALTFNRDGHLLAAGGGAKGALVWDLENDEVVARVAHGGTGGLAHWKDQRGTFSESRGSRQVIAFNPVRDELATAGPDTTARIWDARSGRELQKLKGDALVTAVTFDGQGHWLATSDESGAVCLWDSSSWQRLRCMQQGAPVYSIVFSPSSAVLASVGRDSVANLWRVQSGELLKRFATDEGIESVRFDPAGKIVVTFGADVPTRLWDIQSGTELWKLGPETDGDAGVIFDSTGKTIVLGQTNGELSWWDLASRTLRFSNAKGAMYTRALAASDNSAYFVTISGDEDARAWEMESGHLMRRSPYAGDLMGVAVSHDGRRFAVLGNDRDDRAIEVAEIRPSDAVAAACEKVGRNLTRNEWRQYLEDEPYRLTCPSIPAVEEGQTEEQ